MEATDLRKQSVSWQSWNLTQRQICDLEMLLCGGFKPLSGFLTYRDFESVCNSSRLADGSIWPIPVVLDVTKDFADGLKYGEKIALRDSQGVMLAAFTVEDIWQSSKSEEAENIYGSLNYEHPGVRYLLNNTNAVYLGGRVEAVEPPRHFDFQNLRKSPEELRGIFKQMGWDKVIAFQTRNPIHRAHFELIKVASEKAGAKILIHPVVGMTKPGDIDYFTRVRCYQAIMPKFEPNQAVLSLLPLAMRMAGPREALWHALIRKNYGCSHMIVGRDHASPGKDSRQNNFYEDDNYSKYISIFEDQIGIKIIKSPEVVYVEDDNKYLTIESVPEGKKIRQISGTELRSALERGNALPDWYTFPEVYAELKKTSKPKNEKGITVFLTGLPSAGKSTIAEILMVKFLELGKQNVTLLDGDEVRKLLSSELGFSREHRDLNIRRIGFVASEITKNGGIAICAPIAPYDAVRKEVREQIEKLGRFILVYVDTPIEVCEERDRKGLYAKAKAGIVKGFTGIDDPYEIPHDADLIIDTTKIKADEAAEKILKAIY